MRDGARRSSILCVRFGIYAWFLADALLRAGRYAYLGLCDGMQSSNHLCYHCADVRGERCMCSHACLSACMGWGVRFGTGSLWECSSSAVALRRLRESEGPCAADVIMAGEARMASGVLYIRSYMQECDARHAHACASVKWDSGNKPEIDNTYYVYNCGNDGLYHLAQAEEVHPTPPPHCPPPLDSFAPFHTPGVHRWYLRCAHTRKLLNGNSNLTRGLIAAVSDRFAEQVGAAVCRGAGGIRQGKADS